MLIKDSPLKKMCEIHFKPSVVRKEMHSLWNCTRWIEVTLTFQPQEDHRAASEATAGLSLICLVNVTTLNEGKLIQGVGRITVRLDVKKSPTSSFLLCVLKLFLSSPT